MDDPYFKPSGPLVSDVAVKWFCGTLVALALIAAGVVLGQSQPELVLEIGGGIGLLLLFFFISVF